MKSSSKQHGDKTLQEKVPTVTPDNDNGKAGSRSKKDSSNKGKGPKGENL
jgi:hypothetical protein